MITLSKISSEILNANGTDIDNYSYSLSS